MDLTSIPYYLQLLAQELDNQGKQGAILLVGGAVMVLEVGNRNSTLDIDAAFLQEAAAIRSAVTKIAAREGLQPDWLNDGAKGFLYIQPPTRLWKQYPGLAVYLPALDYLLAMKIVAGRQRDIRDARAILHRLGISDPQAVFDLLQQYVPSQYLTPRVQYIVGDLFI